MSSPILLSPLSSTTTGTPGVPMSATFSAAQASSFLEAVPLTKGTPNPKGFTAYVLAESPELERYFIRPDDSPNLNSPLQIHRVNKSGNHYRRLPEQLTIPGLMKRAHLYYEEHRSEPTVRIRIVKILSIMFILPATLLYLFVQPLIFLNPRKCNGDRVARSPIYIARSWALFLVFVIWTNCQCFGSILGVMLPDRSPTWANEKAMTRKKGHAVLERITEELVALKQLYKAALRLRRESLLNLKEKVAEDAAFIHTADYMTLVETYEKHNKSAQVFEQAIEAGDRDYQKVLKLTVSETNAHVNHYGSVAEWAEDAYSGYANLINVLTGVCLVGAGLTYTAVFSAVRGNVGLMCYSFSLFIVALCIFITIQCLFMWCSRVQTAPIWDPNFWDSMLGFFAGVGCVSVVAAITILVVTVHALEFNVVPGSEYVNPNAANWDAKLVFDVPPQKGAILAFSFMGAGCFIILMIGSLFVLAFGFRRVIWRRGIDARLATELKLDDMV
ncbi:hypothetical protein DL93DRAFT_2232216 [Clavulina sp. PMI_390]|nr:hypothetical protein DL93DRAFT_2232216 [Clavulina sp. PMI_390]